MSRPAAHLLIGDTGHRPAPQTGEPSERVVGKPEHLADVADSAASAVADHSGGKPGALPRVGPVDILDDLFAPLMLKINVDVGRLAPLGRHETLKQ